LRDHGVRYALEFQALVDPEVANADIPDIDRVTSTRCVDHRLQVRSTGRALRDIPGSASVGGPARRRGVRHHHRCDETEDENGAARNRRHGADAGCTRHRIQPSCTPDGRASMQPTRHAIPCLAKLSLGIMTLAPRVRPRTRQARPTPRSGSRAAQTAVGPDHHFRLYAIVR